ncbi:class I SAM-dependent methyltransferase [Cohnella silvisoli]|uniref:Methyltransferase domain-containing protein n=1 Tax=Cohnella silvisoli TaxID=2873699 RepID=A0ABV1KTF5_9BACL|nr:class I SAM-dependent methyltransferase [Cohnella silvisoli]MCD9022947.1 methyltransferase domain-containing protein [Cohnella silvisoli]
MVDVKRKQKVYWEANLYDDSMSFVSQYGEDLVKWLNPQNGERIVDFGCGTGDLAAQIASLGSEVIGVDISPEMVERAQNKYSHLTFQCADGMSWNAEQTYDAVFSNAALHWMKDAEAAIRSMTKGLRPEGRLVVEFGGHRNVEAIVTAVRETLQARNREDAFVMPWYFPTVGEYSTLLEKAGLEVRSAILFDRPTRLDNGENGMKVWLNMFGTAMFPRASEEESAIWIEEAVERLKEMQFKQGEWTADYRRLRIYAIKLRDEMI